MSSKILICILPSTNINVTLLLKVYPPVISLRLLPWYLLLTTHSNSGVAAKVLLDAGADVNTKNWDGLTPLALATFLGHYDVVELIITHPKVQVNVQVRTFMVIL